MKRPHVENLGDKLRRAGWLFLTALFIFTGLGVGVYAFYESTHQTDSSQTANNSQQPTNTTACAFSGAQSAPQLPIPTTYTTSGSVSNLQKTDLTVGSGATAKQGDCLLVKYYGTIANTGKTSPGLENYDQPLGLQFLLGEGYVIPGWDQGIAGMKVGGERRLVIPSNLAYGASGQCNTQGQNPCTSGYAIPPNTDLVFVVKLLSIK